VQLTGSLKPDSSITLAYSATVFNTWYGKNTDIASGNISGNGNDGYFLYSGGKHSTGTLMDAYGVIDENGSGTEWEYTNSRAYRIYSVTAPDTIWNTSEWMIEPATTSQMTPKWHHRILTWNGSASSDINDNNNWNESGLTIPDYKADASCKLNIANNGIAPVITENKTFSIIEMEAGATLTISNNATLEIIGK
jgi:hypothetical protein